MSRPSLLLLTGPPGVGKTTVCLGLARLLGEKGWKVGGIVTLAEGRRRLALDLGSGERRLLAVGSGPMPARMGEESPAGPSGPRWGPYRFSRPALDWGNATVLRAVAGGVDLVILDEVGPLELVLGEGFLPALRAVLEGPPSGLIVVRPALLERVAGMAGRLAVRREVTLENRQALPEEMAAWLERQFLREVP